MYSVTSINCDNINLYPFYERDDNELVSRVGAQVALAVIVFQ